jgi:regulator of protease activity HflC (stomatin/prohibitin superfamily)
MADVDILIIALVFFVIIVVLLLIYNSVKIVSPYEQAIYIRLGRFVRILNPGFNWVTPIISQVIRLDLRTQVLEIPRQEVITKDNSPTNVDAIIYTKVIDPNKAYFQVANYRAATVYLAQTTLRSIIGDMELDEILSNREKINLRLRDILDEATDKWGVKVEAVEIREVDPAPKVKQAMEEQTSAERMRRATILRADGEKRGAILSAEGQKRSRILQAEGSRQSKILEAEGERLAIILQSQGEAQKLRILSVGASPLDSKALAVLSMQTMQALGNSPSTKWIIPFEITKIMEGMSEFLGVSRQTPAREVSDQAAVEKAVGTPDDILGPIPSAGELRLELKNLEDAMEKEKAEAEAIGALGKGKPDKEMLNLQ